MTSPTRTAPLKSPALWFLLSLIFIAVFTLFGPAEKSLGTNVRVVYLHGAWVWAALITFGAAALAGVVGLLLRRESWQRWSRALGRTGLFFWITYLPISLWAMQTNWNGLFLAEPRWRVAFVFAIGGLVLQMGIAVAGDPAWAAGGNLVFLATLMYALGQADQVMHPPSPIFDSEVRNIQYFFIGLVALTLLAAWQVARWWWHRFERARV